MAAFLAQGLRSFISKYYKEPEFLGLPELRALLPDSQRRGRCYHHRESWEPEREA